MSRWMASIAYMHTRNHVRYARELLAAGRYAEACAAFVEAIGCREIARSNVADHREHMARGRACIGRWCWCRQPAGAVIRSSGG